MERLLPTPQTTLRQMLVHAGCQTTFNYLLKGMLKEFADRPFMQAPEDVRRNFLYGLPVGDGRLSHNLASHLRYKLMKGREVNGCLSCRVCPACGGDRVSAEARQVTLGGQHIGQLSRMTLAELEPTLCDLPDRAQLSPLGQNLLGEILDRLHSLQASGLSHLTLYRSLPSLSGGELQRLFLSTHIGSEMDLLIYVLDEPTIGLHEVEKQRLLAQLRALQSHGNTILLVEHDPHLIAAADHVIDIGPLAGSAGGEVVYQGDYPGLLSAPQFADRQLSFRARQAARPAENPDPARRAPPQADRGMHE